MVFSACFLSVKDWRPRGHVILSCFCLSTSSSLKLCGVPVYHIEINSIIEKSYLYTSSTQALIGFWTLCEAAVEQYPEDTSWHFLCNTRRTFKILRRPLVYMRGSANISQTFLRSSFSSLISEILTLSPQFYWQLSGFDLCTDVMSYCVKLLLSGVAVNEKQSLFFNPSSLSCVLALNFAGKLSSFCT